LKLGSKEVVDELVVQYENGETNVLRGDISINDVASLLKRFLSECEIFPKALVRTMLSKAAKLVVPGESPHPSEKLNKMKSNFRDGLKSLPVSEYNILCATFKYLRNVTDQVENTKMSPYAISVCIAPVLFLRYIDLNQAKDGIHHAIFVCNVFLDDSEWFFQERNNFKRMSLVRRFSTSSSSDKRSSLCLDKRSSLQSLESFNENHRLVRIMIDDSENRQLAWLNSFEPFQSAGCKEFKRISVGTQSRSSNRKTIRNKILETSNSSVTSA